MPSKSAPICSNSRRGLPFKSHHIAQVLLTSSLCLCSLLHNAAEAGDLGAVKALLVRCTCSLEALTKLTGVMPTR